VIDRRLDLGSGRSIRLLDVERHLDEREPALSTPYHRLELADLHVAGVYPPGCGNKAGTTGQRTGSGQLSLTTPATLSRFLRSLTRVCDKRLP
jgi:hypothetical protein